MVHANQVGRYAALVLLTIFGVSLLLPALADRLARPVVALGNRLAGAGDTSTVWRSLLLGVATGMLWAPCAGPILGLVLTGAALNGASVQTSLLLAAYAAGAASSLAVALGIGGRVFAAMKRSMGAGEWLAARPGRGRAGRRGDHRHRHGHRPAGAAVGRQHHRDRTGAAQCGGKGPRHADAGRKGR